VWVQAHDSYRVLIADARDEDPAGGIGGDLNGATVRQCDDALYPASRE
jgi:hypothetical protein